jgi:hypothetical protein
MLAVVQGGFLGIIPLILVIAAAILFIIAGVGRYPPGTEPTTTFNRLIAWGLTCIAVAMVITMAGGM